MTDWKNLEDEVDNAIKKGCPINFDSKKPEERRYIQKCAEIYLSIYGIQLTIATFAFATGVTYIFLLFQDDKMWPIVIVGFFLVIGGVLLFFIPPNYLATPNISCQRIILDAEKIVSSEAFGESKEPQQTPQKQERFEPIVEPKERKKGFFNEIIGIIILFFTVYAFTRDYFIEDRTKSVYALLQVVTLKFPSSNTLNI